MLTYQDIGLKPFINASGTITTLGGSHHANRGRRVHA